MSKENETLITKLERGRAVFAYRCAEEGKKIITKNQINNEWYEDDKYKSYVKKLPSMILSNGLGQTIAFIVSKKQKLKKKDNNDIIPGEKANPKNAFDLIYKQITDYLRSDSTIRTQIPPNSCELIEWIINLPSKEYMYVTEEILAFLNWLKKFGEGMIETEEEG